LTVESQHDSGQYLYRVRTEYLVFRPEVSFHYGMNDEKCLARGLDQEKRIDTIVEVLT